MLVALVVLFLVDIVGMGNSSGRLIPYFALGDGVLHEVWRWVTYPFVNLKIAAPVSSHSIFTNRVTPTALTLSTSPINHVSISI